MGQWSMGLEQGFGVYRYGPYGEFGGDRYEGMYFAGNRQGTGSYTYAGGVDEDGQMMPGGIFLGDWLKGRMHGTGIFKSLSPHFTFKGIFHNDIPMSGELMENRVGFRPMTRIETVEIFKQKPKELDEDTIREYARQNEEQKEQDRPVERPLLPKPPPVGHAWPTHDY